MLSQDAKTGRPARLDADIDHLWTTFKNTGEHNHRNQLIEHYLPLVRHHARQVRAKLPAGVELDDLVEAGVFGLMDALDGFDLERGIRFESYAAMRIRGAMYDELRNTDWLPRLVRMRITKLQKAEEHLAKQLGRAPTDEELAEALNWSTQEMRRARRETTQCDLASLSAEMKDDEGARVMRGTDVLEDTRAAAPTGRAQREEIKQVITRGLTRAEKLVLILYYYEQLTMREIGATLNLSESRVSQMHSSIMARLKSTLRHREKELAGLIAAVA